MRCTKNSFCNFWKRAKTWRATSILHGCCNPRDREKAGQEVKVGVSIFGYIMTFLEFRAINACCSWGEQTLYHQQYPEKNNANCGYNRFPILILIMSPPDSDWRIILEWLGSHSTRRCRDSSLHVSSFYKKKIFSSRKLLLCNSSFLNLAKMQQTILILCQKCPDQTVFLSLSLSPRTG